jgi:hypothetical protein
MAAAPEAAIAVKEAATNENIADLAIGCVILRVNNSRRRSKNFNAAVGPRFRGRKAQSDRDLPKLRPDRHRVHDTFRYN